MSSRADLLCTSQVTSPPPRPDRQLDARLGCGHGSMQTRSTSRRCVRSTPTAGSTSRDLTPDPFSMFQRWLGEALDAGVHEPNAMVLSTAGADGRPSSRMVLLKGLDERGFVLFTNQTSRKGRRARRQPAVRAALPVAPARATGADRGHARRCSSARRSRPTTASRPGARSSAPGPAGSRSRSRPAKSWRRRTTTWPRGSRGGRAGARPLGRLPDRAGDGRVLAGPAGADARPAGLRARRGRLADPAAGSVEKGCE